jgi:NDP-sugar pyrophosphorylase family protein
MILAAGRGERLRPLTDTMPKPLIRVNGRPLIDYAIETCRRAGIADVIVNLHHFGEQIRHHVGDGTAHGVRVAYSEEPSLRGSGGGILQARELLGEHTFVTLNADTIISIDLEQVIASHRERRATATLVLRKDPNMEQFGVIRLEPDDRVGAFLDTARTGAVEPLEAFMYTGVQVLEPTVFAYMPAGPAPFSITELTYPALLRAGERVYGYRFDGSWITVGTPEELALAESELDRRY